MHKLSHFRVVFQLYIQLVGGECRAGFGSIWSPNCLTGDHIQLFYNHPSSSAEVPTSFGNVEDLYNHNSLIISEVFQVANAAEKNCLAHHLHMFWENSVKGSSAISDLCKNRHYESYKLGKL